MTSTAPAPSARPPDSRIGVIAAATGLALAAGVLGVMLAVAVATVATGDDLYTTTAGATQFLRVAALALLSLVS